MPTKSECVPSGSFRRSVRFGTELKQQVASKECIVLSNAGSRDHSRESTLFWQYRRCNNGFRPARQLAELCDRDRTHLK